MSRESRPLLTWGGEKALAPPPTARLTPVTEEKAGSSSAAACCLITGDNLLALAVLAKEAPESVTLAYLDPPFLTGREHYRVERAKVESGVTRVTRPAFDDRWDSLSDYLAALSPRLELIHRLLAPHGSMVLHVDPKTSHYLKVLCDEIFGIEAFASEVIWRYRRWPAKTKNFQRVHDVMLRYVKDRNTEPRFNQLYEPLAPSTRKTWGDRKQRAVTDGSGRRLKSSKTEEASRGTPLGDVWEIGIVAPVAKERTGYPTQKPEELLQRWIQVCSDPDDLVLDPYMGSGTTLKVARNLRRRAVGIDMGKEALGVTRSRLENAGIAFVTREVKSPVARGKTRSPQPPSSSVMPRASDGAA